MNPLITNDDLKAMLDEIQEIKNISVAAMTQLYEEYNQLVVIALEYLKAANLPTITLGYPILKCTIAVGKEPECQGELTRKNLDCIQQELFKSMKDYKQTLQESYANKYSV